MSNTRFAAALVLASVMQGTSLTNALEQQLTKTSSRARGCEAAVSKRSRDPVIISDRDRAFVQTLCYGVCRFYPRLRFVLRELLNKPLQQKEKTVYALLLVGLYQLMAMRTPHHAAISETVNASKLIKKPWAQGLVNAVLREYLRTKTKLENKIESNQEALYAHPAWLIQAIAPVWGDRSIAIFNANNEQAPLTLRVNRLCISRDNYLQQIDGQIIPETQSGVILDKPVAVANIPGFISGEVSVQDGGAQLAAELLKLAPNLRVLDACAAPGGKLAHILEIEPKLASIIAVEKEASRISSIQENLSRLHLNAQCITADARDVRTYWDGELFDRILCDAPCSASGVIRRHPDIKLLRKPTDIKAYAEKQLSLLEALWPLLKPQGILLYATCSIFPAENADVIQEFLGLHASDAKEDVIDASWGIACTLGRQILPGMHQMDGFYYARLRKI